ncbi:hypothetical protein [Pseudomonas sp. 18058]|uniref:hypothetical protein n=1 Tax=Pseudomonas sp. 18058 TaxID=2681406 RepID=UPI00211514A8|nr:hypothetical protein [Pseudomonas sp. 18058]
MISNHLSLVEALRPKSNELAAQVEKYLAAGGKIEEAEPIGYKPKPVSYSNQMPPAPKPFVRRRPPAPPQPLSAQDIRHQERVKEKALLERIGAEKRTLIVSKALDDALHVLGERHGFEEWQETVSTFIINLAGAPTEESERFVNMSRPVFVPNAEQSRQLERFAKNGVDTNH